MAANTSRISGSRGPRNGAGGEARKGSSGGEVLFAGSPAEAGTAAGTEGEAGAMSSLPTFISGTGRTETRQLRVSACIC
jgi:hypothetical protein